MKHLVLLFVLVLAISTVALSQGVNQGDVRFSATVAATSPLTVAVGGDVAWTDLRPGVSYQCIADAVVSNTNITPFVAETFTPAQIDIAGEPNMQVIVTFALPTTLYPVAGIGTVTMTYNNQSGSFLDATSGVSTFFNPESPVTVETEAGGVATLFLGGNPTVSTNATGGDEFVGYALVSAEYVGM